MGISEVRRVLPPNLGVVTRLDAFVNFLPHNVPHFILVDEVQNFFLLTTPDGLLDSASIDQMRRIFKSLVGSSPIHCTWVLTGSSMATYWANLGLAPVNGFSILNHLPSLHVPTRVGAGVLERTRSVLRNEFSAAAMPSLPEPLLQFEFANTVGELLFYVTQWCRLPSTVTSSKPPAEFCMDTLADRVYPEIVADFGRVLGAMDVPTRLLVVQVVNPEVGVEESRLPRGLLRYFRPYLKPPPTAKPYSQLLYMDSPIVYAALATLVDVEGNVVPQLTASHLIVDFAKLTRFCGSGDYLTGLVPKNANTLFFKDTPPNVVALLSEWCDKLGPAFWQSAYETHWFNVTLWDPSHKAARSALDASTYEPWQYLHLYLRLWRNSVEHKKKVSVAASFARMRTLPRELLSAFGQLQALSW